ncbi:hypothetical protein [Piscinibacter sp.]|uniref:hypothetical protein n=1 Tax=Piscinibacter sp. TaxID=1903157 RepID=UPI0039E55DD6
MSASRTLAVVFFTGLLSAAAGLVLVGWLAGQCIRWYRISSFEGGSAYFAIMLALGGAIAGFVIGAVCAWRVGSAPGGTFVRGLALALAVDLALVALATGLAYAAADHPPPRAESSAPENQPPTEAQRAEARERREARALAALPADAPLEAWLPFTRVEVAEARRAEVRSRIAARPDLAAELRALALGDDEALAAEALRLVAEMPDAAAAWRDAVRATGPDLIARLRQGIAVSAADDPSYLWAAAISTRFSGWLQAALILRKRFGDDVSAELRTLRDLARQRPDSYVMQRDIARVAEFYGRQ